MTPAGPRVSLPPCTPSLAREVPSTSRELGLSCVSPPRARSGFTAESLRCAMLTPALDPRPTVLLASIRSCWKDTGRATCDLFCPPSLTRPGHPHACCHKAFSCQRPRQGHVINTRLPDDSHSGSERTRGAVAPSCRRASGCTSGLGRQSTHPPALTGVRVGSNQTRIRKRQGRHHVHSQLSTVLAITTAGTPPFQPRRQSQLEISSKIAPGGDSALSSFKRNKTLLFKYLINLISSN